MRPPRIAVSGVLRRWDGGERTGVNAVYARAVARAGAVPLILPPFVDPAHAGAALDGVDGLLLSGGEDIGPACYRAAPSPRLGHVDAARDAFELALVAAARERALPVLGICRGLQLLNVALGGTLWQDLPSERPSTIQHDRIDARHARTHPVEVVPGSLAAQALGTTRLGVNSFHHQAVRDLAPALVVSARAEDGVVEAVELPGDWWVLAVQWHPEEMVDEADAPDRGLFVALAEAARAAYCR